MDLLHREPSRNGITFNANGTRDMLLEVPAETSTSGLLKGALFLIGYAAGRWVARLKRSVHR